MVQSLNTFVLQTYLFKKQKKTMLEKCSFRCFFLFVVVGITRIPAVLRWSHFYPSTVLRQVIFKLCGIWKKK